MRLAALYAVTAAGLVAGLILAILLMATARTLLRWTVIEPRRRSLEARHDAARQAAAVEARIDAEVAAAAGRLEEAYAVAAGRLRGISRKDHL